jgi:SAM-dependent methyltransferase
MSETAYVHGTDPAEQDRLSRLNRMTNAAFEQFLGLNGGERVMEIGSGLGILAEEVAGGLPRGFFAGVEYSPEQLAAMRRRRRELRGPAPNAFFCRGDARALPFLTSSFDLVYMRYVLEHVGNPEQVLREAHRVLRDGGRLRVQENNILAVDVDPDCPVFMRVWRQLAVLQQRMGGDALIGKRLFGLLRRAEFRNIELSVQPEVHYQGSEYFHPWIENLIEIIEGIRERLLAERLATSNEVNDAIKELRAVENDADGAAFFYWNRAAAEK